MIIWMHASVPPHIYVPHMMLGPMHIGIGTLTLLNNVQWVSVNKTVPKF